jgi:short-subunit dehydrogenase
VSGRALVTGASAGIGTEFARELAARGHDLVLVARDTAALELLAEELAGNHDVEVEVLTADLRDAEQLATVVHRVGAADDPIDLLINNAGYGTAGEFAALPVEPEIGMVELNIAALVRLTHAALAVMVPAGRGGILNVASLGAYQPSPGFATYAATKAFVHSFTQAVHEETLKTGVHVTVLCPGFTRTRFQDQAGMDATNIPNFMWQTPAEVARAGLDALEKGRAVCVPGPLNSATAAFSSVLPGVVSRKLAYIVAQH